MAPSSKTEFLRQGSTFFISLKNQKKDPAKSRVKNRD
jgi:hypothetical protein